MKKVAILIISLYQKIISPLLVLLLGGGLGCRYQLTCSEYTKRAIGKHGVVKGMGLGLKRVASCSPLTLPKKELSNV